ncbi:hypothetical protein TMatcc_002701 [Talaromyces marneffei ATCC 18224]
MILIIANLLLLACSAFPVNEASSPLFTTTDGNDDSLLAPRDTEYFTLRVMPLGASITQGYLSSDNNGYRKVLREQLRYSGWPVNMVGGLAGGTMLDNNHEGHGGYRIDQVTAVVENNISEMPNLILLNVGTNDALQDYNTDSAGERLDSLLTFLYGAIPNTTIVLSTLLPNTIQPDLVANINDQYHDVYDKREAAGYRIILADMYTFLTTDDLQDGIHPTDYGYEKMASVCWAAIQTAQDSGYLSAPIDTGFSDFPNNTCQKTYDSSMDDYAQTQEESGTDDGKYVHTSQDMGRLLDIASVAGNIYQGVNLAQLVNVDGGYRENALDELVWTHDGDGTYMFLNENSGVFGSSVKLDVKISCLAKGVRWGDVNNDGLDDFICIGADGAMYVAINQGATNNVPTFEDIGQVMAAPGGNMTQTNVRLGDIDGDGRIDYCLIAENGDIHCWRNGGQGDAPTSSYGGYWQDLGTVFMGKGLGDINGVRLVDINGDFRSDWLWVDDTGKVTTYINNRGTGKGSLVPDWVSVGVTHAGMGVAGARDRVKFGNVYAGNGADYLYVDSVVESASNASIYDNYAHVWKNTGYGGTALKGDGDYYCDMRGTGMDDYVWVSPDGVGYLYGNTLNPPNWDPAGVEIFDAGVERKALHLADFDGDGKCDLWLVDRATGAAEVWINNWNSSAMSWNKRGVVTGEATCTQSWGVGLYDIGLRFHDINGDQRADYLCMEPNGRTTGALNLGENAFEDVGQIKHSEGYDRANHKWADVNGDGLVDFLWVDKFSGDASVWQNAGQMPNGTLIDGSSFHWTPLGAAYEGEDRGANIHFPNLGGLGRADYHQVIPRTNVAYTWYNVCPGGGISALDDESASIDPQLPAYSSS